MESLIEDICQKTGSIARPRRRSAGYMKASVTRIPQLLQGGEAAGRLKGTSSSVAGKVDDAIRR